MSNLAQETPRTRAFLHLRPRFAQIPEWVLDLVSSGVISPTAFTVYAQLCRYADFQRRDGAFPSISRLSGDANLSVKTVEKSLKALRDCGAITGRKAAGKPTVYILPMDPPHQEEEDSSSGGSTPEDSGGAADVYPRPTEDSTVTTHGRKFGTNESHTTRASKRTPTGHSAAPQVPVGSTPIDEMFEEFWSVAVRKIEKRTARREFAKALKEIDFEELMRLWKKANHYWGKLPKKEQQFIPHPRTWLHQARWEDEDGPAGSHEPTNPAIAEVVPVDDTPQRIEWGEDGMRLVPVEADQ